MTLVSTERGVVGVIAKVARQDEAAAGVLLRLAAYEALCEMADVHGPEHDRLAQAEFAKRSDAGRRALVRTFIDRRLAGEQVDDVIKAADTLGEVVSKYDPKETRDKNGRWTVSGVMNAATQGLSVLGNPSRSARMDALGGLVTMVGDPTAGAVVAAAGRLGDEAERVLGPGIQRALYRYRGTERRPSAALINYTHDRPEQLQARAEQYRQQGFTAQQARLGVQGDAVAAYLVGQLPSAENAELSLASGRVPPSRGVIIGQDGDVVSEAVGINGDHYVPFDLKNLAELEGGQYVRTRSAGGPTREDLYTGLMTGARQMQVVSRSGVFTVEFDPDLRGIRRYGDKARSMVDRYQHILETVNSGDVAAVPLDETTMRELRATAMRRSGNDVGDAKKLLPDLVRQRMQTEAYNRDREEEQAQVSEAVANRVATEERRSGRTFSAQERARFARDVTPEVLEQVRSETPRALRLDGEGYERALNALKDEFPYFIRDVRRQDLRSFANDMGLRTTNESFPVNASDRGFVPGNQNLPTLRNGRDRDYAVTSRSRDQSSTTPGTGQGPGTGSGGPRPGGDAPKSAPAPEGATGAIDLPAVHIADRRESPTLVQAISGPDGADVRYRAGDDWSALSFPLEHLASAEEDKLNENMTGADYLFYLDKRKFSGRARAAADWALSSASSQEKQKLVDALNQTAARADGNHAEGWTNGRPEHFAAAAKSARNLSTLISATLPGKRLTRDNADALVDDDATPYDFPELDKLGVDPRNIRAYVDTASSFEATRDLGRYVEEFMRPSNSLKTNDGFIELRNSLSNLRAASEALRKPDERGSMTPQEAQAEYDFAHKDVILRHQAWAIAHRLQTVQQLFGKEGEQSPTPTGARVTKSARVLGRRSSPLSKADRLPSRLVPRTALTSVSSRPSHSSVRKDDQLETALHQFWSTLLSQ